MRIRIETQLGRVEIRRYGLHVKILNFRDGPEQAMDVFLQEGNNIVPYQGQRQSCEGAWPVPVPLDPFKRRTWKFFPGQSLLLVPIVSIFLFF